MPNGRVILGRYKNVPGIRVVALDVGDSESWRKFVAKSGKDPFYKPENVNVNVNVTMARFSRVTTGYHPLRTATVNSPRARGRATLCRLRPILCVYRFCAVYGWGRVRRYQPVP
jgi:hypothetical protein